MQSSSALQLAPTPTVGKVSGRNSRRDSGQNMAMELSSKREYMDQLCQSPSAATPHTNNHHINSRAADTLERASNQDDILGVTTTGG